MKNAPIGVFDSGLGGLAVARQLFDKLPAEDVVYFADFAHLPYGPRPAEEVRGFALEAIEFLLGKGVKAVLIGCNTASAAMAGVAQERAAGIPVVGMIEAAVEAVLRGRQVMRVGVVGTIGTINSHAYQKAMHRRSPSVEVFGHACPDLLRLAEQADIGDSQRIRALAQACVAPLIAEDIAALVLGCTDFTCIAEELRAVVPPEVRIIDPAAEVVAVTARILQEKAWNRAGNGTGDVVFYASGTPPKGVREFAQRVFGISIARFEGVG